MIPPRDQFAKLVAPFPPKLIGKAPKGKFGDYIAHYDINQQALRIVGPHDFRIIELIRGDAPELVTDKTTYPARQHAVVGALAEIKAVVGGTTVTICEVGSVDNPAMNNDAENAKLAASDAYKRCWMRVGLGLEMWSDPYWLPAQLVKDEEELAKPFITEAKAISAKDFLETFPTP